jgi:hypothetical protein
MPIQKRQNKRLSNMLLELLLLLAVCFAERETEPRTAITAV